MKRSAFPVLFLGASHPDRDRGNGPGRGPLRSHPQGDEVREARAGQLQADDARRHGLLDHVLQEDGEAPGGRGGRGHPRGLRDHRGLRHPRRQGQAHRHGHQRRAQGAGGESGQGRSAHGLHQDRRRSDLAPRRHRVPFDPHLQPPGARQALAPARSAREGLRRGHQFGK